MAASTMVANTAQDYWWLWYTFSSLTTFFPNLSSLIWTGTMILLYVVVPWLRYVSFFSFPFFWFSTTISKEPADYRPIWRKGCPVSGRLSQDTWLLRDRVYRDGWRGSSASNGIPPLHSREHGHDDSRSWRQKDWKWLQGANGLLVQERGFRASLLLLKRPIFGEINKILLRQAFPP